MKELNADILIEIKQILKMTPIEFNNSIAKTFFRFEKITFHRKRLPIRNRMLQEFFLDCAAKIFVDAEFAQPILQDVY